MFKEGSLIAFTLLSQFTIGFMLFYTILYASQKGFRPYLKTGFHYANPEFIMLIFMGMAVLLSFLHLGNPINSVHALKNLRDSWISREILSLSVFSFSLFFLFITRWRFNKQNKTIAFLFWTSTVSGLALLISMIKLYMLPTAITWNTWHTPLGFLLSSLILGLVGIVFFSFSKPSVFKLNQNFFFLLIGLLALEMINVGFNQYTINQIDSSYKNLFISDGTHAFLSAVRLLIGLICIALAINVNAIHRKKVNLRSEKVILLLLTLMILFEQLIGRMMFYASYVREGI